MSDIPESSGQRGLSQKELESAGNFGLIYAAERFDADAGCRFSTYAQFWIRQTINLALSENRAVRIPHHVNQDLAKLKRLQRSREQTTQSLAEHLDMPAEKVEGLQDLLMERFFSMDRPREDGSVWDSLEDPSTSDPLEGVYESQRRSDVLAALDRLKDREKSIVRQYFGIGGRRKTLEEIGTGLGLTRERIRQIKDSALARMRKNRALRDHFR